MIKFYLIRRSFLLLLVLCSLQGFAQTRVAGKVTSGDDGTGLPGVSILEKGTSNGTVTDASGNYSISVSENAVLVFSFVGFRSQEVSISGRTSIDVTLESDVTALSEIVIVGYGQQEKKDVTGSIVSVTGKDFNKGVFTSPQDLLVGKVAGVQVTPGSGAPGSGSQILIRGGSSVNASNAPLIVVDGFALDNNGVSGMPNALSSINPNDIESMTVLKDASATAIYGSRASNGVILITTKKGGSGKPQVSYNGQFSMSTPVDKIDVLTGDEFRTLMGELEGTLGINAAAIAKLGTENTDWQEEIFRNAFSMDHNVSLSGTTSDVPFRVSYGYTDQQGILKTTSMQRHSINLNVSPAFLDDNLKVTASFKGNFSKHNFSDEGAIGSAVSFDPTQPVMNGNTRYGGYFAWVANQADVNSAPNSIAPRNPVARLDLTDNRSNVYRAIGNLEVDYRFTFLPELRAHMVAGFDVSNSTGFNNTSVLAPWTNELGNLTDYTGETESRLLDLYLNYTKDVNDHKFDVMAGHSYQSFERNSTNFSRSVDGSIYNDYDEDSDGNPVPSVAPRNPNYLLSFFGRVNYNFDDRFLVTATLRADASSRFDQAFGLFPAAAIAWRISNEGFMAASEVVSDLKLRAGYGVTGQQDVGGTYPYLPQYAISNNGAQYQFGNQWYQTYRPNAYDASFKWEETTTYNIGIDFGFLKNRLTGSFDYYQRESNDLINTIPIPAGSNLNNFLLTNVGNLENTGFEVTLQAQAIKKGDMGWTVGVNLAHNKNQITKLTATDDPNYQGVAVGGISGAVGNTIQNNNVGYPRNSFFVFQQVYDDTGRPIEGLYVDRTGNGGNVVSSELNKYRYQSPNPRILMGLTSNFNYRDFDFFFAGRLSIDNYVYNNGAANTFHASSFNGNTASFNNLRRSIYDTGFSTAQYWSDYYVENASFFKMDNMSLGYTKAFMGEKLRARFSFTVQNAFLITEYSGLDPELSNGIDNNLYPRPRVFLLGVNLTY